MKNPLFDLHWSRSFNCMWNTKHNNQRQKYLKACWGIFCWVVLLSLTFSSVCFNVHRLWIVTIFRVTETWRLTSWPGSYTSWWQFAQQPVLVFPLSLSRLSFPPSESPRGNCGIIYEVVAAWSRPVYGMACWPKSIQPRRSGPGFLLC